MAVDQKVNMFDEKVFPTVVTAPRAWDISSQAILGAAHRPSLELRIL